MEGWIKLHRQLLGHWIFANPLYLKAWITMLMVVNYESKSVLIHGELIKCDRGQSILSLNSWVKTFGKGWSIKRVRTFFKLLSDDSIIVIEGLRKTTRLTICKYDTYQDIGQAKGTQKADKGQAEGRQRATTKEGKEGKERKEIKDLPFGEAFKIAWDEWIEYRRQMKFKNTDASISMQLKFLSTKSEQEAIQIINTSIMNGWQGLFAGTKKVVVNKNPGKLQ